MVALGHSAMEQIRTIIRFYPGINNAGKNYSYVEEENIARAACNDQYIT